jgi:large subunit ribosomal protein L32
MGALPKQRTSKGRKGRRRSHLRVQLPQIERCPECHQYKVAHRVCMNCGKYRGRQVLFAKEEETTA